MKSWAIVVGINTYPQQALQKPLLGAVADACDFADWALDPAGGNVAPDRLFFWTYPWPTDPRLQASLAGAPKWFNTTQGTAAPDQTRAPYALEIAKTIEDVGRTLHTDAVEAGDDERRRVYVFLAGHGIRARTFDSSQETCFLAGDFRPTSSDTVAGLVPCDSFRRALLNARFAEAILFFDCCRSETARSTLKALPVSDYDGQPTLPCSIAFAAQDNKLAYETKGPPVRGAFSSALLRGLRTYRKGAASELHAGPLRQYVIDTIKDFTLNGQIPNMWYQPDPDGPLIVAGAPAVALPPQAGPLVDVSALPSGVSLILVGGDNKPLQGIGPLVVAGPTLQIPPLEPGLYLLEVSDGSGRSSMFRHPSLERIHVG